MKLTKEQIKEIVESNLPIKELANQFNVSENCILYHKNPELRTKVIERAKKADKLRTLNGTNWRQRNPERVREYMRNYIKNRYNNDPEFKAKMQERNRNYQTKKRGELNGKINNRVE